MRRSPMPWCGTDSSAVDRLPDATLGYAVHVVYVRPPGGADRFGELAPRIVGDVAAMEAWWRSQDAARSPRFDLFPIACATTFGALDITNVELTQPISADRRRVQRDPAAARLGAASTSPRRSISSTTTGRRGSPATSRSAARARRPAAPRRSGHGPRLPRLLRRHRRPTRCGRSSASTSSSTSSAPSTTRAPHQCNDGHVCDVEPDLMSASLTGEELETHVLDSGRDDYYGHSGSWLDVQDSLFLERLDSPDRSAPTVPAALVVRSDPGAAVVTFSWRASSDDVGPVTYWVYENGRFRQRGAANLRAADRTRRRHGHLLRPRRRCGRAPEPARHGPLQAGLGDRRRAGPVAARHGPRLRRSAPCRSARRPRRWCSRGRPCATPAACATTGSRSAPGRSSSTKPAVTISRATLRTAVSVAAGRPGRQRRPDDDRPAPPPALTSGAERDLRRSVRAKT